MIVHSHLQSCALNGRLVGGVEDSLGWRTSRQVKASCNRQHRSWQHLPSNQQDHQLQPRLQQQQEQNYRRQSSSEHTLTGNQARRPSSQERAEFEALWLGFKKELQLSKEAAAAISQRVYQGQLPCNAPFLRARALQLIALDASFPDMRFRTLLSSHSATLAHPPELLGDRARRLQRLLPHQDTTTVMATVMEHMSASADVLALWLCELELPFQEVFKMGVPPAVFSYCYSQAAATATGLQGRRGRQATFATAEDVFPTCDVLEMLARCEVLRDLVGPESGYAALCRHAALLDVTPDQMRARVLSLQECLSLHEGVDLCRVVEGAPALLALPDGVAVQRAEQLRMVLGWSNTGVRALVIARSQVLLLDTDVAARKLLLLREASAVGGVAGRGAWCLELLGGQGEVKAMARALLSGWEVLSRVQYLAQRPAERAGMRATEVLEESRQAFARAVPRYSRWWVENGRQLVNELGFEEGEFARDGGGSTEEEGDFGADVDARHEDMESQVMDKRLRWNGRADKQVNGVDGRLAQNSRPVQDNPSQPASTRHAPWQGVGRSR